MAGLGGQNGGWQLHLGRSDRLQEKPPEPHLRTAAPSLLAHLRQGPRCSLSPPVPASSGPHRGQLEEEEEESSDRLLLKVNKHK